MTAIVILVVGAYLVFEAINYKTKLSIYLLLIYMIIVFIFCNSGNPDIEIYQWRFNDGLYDDTYLFGLIMKGVNALGGSFVAYKVVVATFVVCITYYTIKKTTAYSSVALALFAIYPFFSTISQLKNGMMMVIVMYAIVTFIQDNKHSIIRYIISIIIASFFHPVALYYLVFLFAKIKRKKKSTIFLIILATIAVELIIEYNLLYELIQQFISDKKYLVYFDYKSAVEYTTEDILNWKGKLVSVVVHTAGYLIFRMIYKNFKKNLILDNYEVYLDKLDGEKKPYCFNVYQLNMIDTMFLITFSLIPLYMLSPTYLRVFQNIILLMYIVLAQYLSYIVDRRRYTHSTSYRKIIVILYALMATFISSYSQGYFIEMLNSFSMF